MKTKQESFDFEALYQKFPRKGEGKKFGMKRLRERIKTAESYADFERALDNYIAICIAEKRERRYTLMWKTFVNNYEDYVLIEPPAPSGPVDQLQRILKGNL